MSDNKYIPGELRKNKDGLTEKEFLAQYNPHQRLPGWQPYFSPEASAQFLSSIPSFSNPLLL